MFGRVLNTPLVSSLVYSVYGGTSSNKTTEREYGVTLEAL